MRQTKVRVEHRDAIIANGEQESAVVDLTGFTLCGIHLPADLTGTALTILVENGKGVYTTMADGAGSDVSYTVAASKYIPVSPSRFSGCNKIKVKSGSAEEAARTITLSLRDID